MVSKNSKLWALAIIAPILIATNGSMSVATFLKKADALKAQGILAIGSPDIELLKNEVQGASQLYRSDIRKSRKAGKPPHSCPPAKGKAKIDANDLIAHFRSYPATRRTNISVRTGLYDLMKKRYPCK